MAKLIWDTVGDRRFETGVDHAVLYHPYYPAVPWNGLDSVTDSNTQEVKAFYQDGIKYLERVLPGAYAGKLTAYTYPDELATLTGLEEFVFSGVFIHDQRSLPFSLSYRTKVGNDVDGIDHGYKLHVLYNVVAIPGDVQYSSLGDQISPQTFEWDLSGTPPLLQGIRPTCHISFDSRRIDPGLLAAIETILYGGDEAEAYLITQDQLLNFIEAYNGT